MGKKRGRLKIKISIISLLRKAQRRDVFKLIVRGTHGPFKSRRKFIRKTTKWKEKRQEKRREDKRQRQKKKCLCSLENIVDFVQASF